MENNWKKKKKISVNFHYFLRTHIVQNKTIIFIITKLIIAHYPSSTLKALFYRADLKLARRAFTFWLNATAPSFYSTQKVIQSLFPLALRYNPH